MYGCSLRWVLIQFQTMEACCDLEVDVNGKATFLVNKNILASMSGRFSKLFTKLTGSTRKLKVIFHDFPGGPHGFELMSRCCYNNGRILITPYNVVLIHSAANFLEMGRDCSATLDLVEQTEKFLVGISNWNWSELVVALKHCHDLLPAQNVSVLFQKILDCLVGRLAFPFIASPYTTFSDNSSYQFSYDTRSTDSIRNYCSTPTTWWFEDLLFLKVDLIDIVIQTMISHRLDHAMIYKFLIFYLKAGLCNAATSDKCKISEIVISMLSFLDRSCLSCKGLFEVYRLVSSLRISEQHKVRLESLMGSQLDQATVNHLLITSPCEKEEMYDVNLVLRLVEVFLYEANCWFSVSRLKKVGSLMDSYLNEVAPDLLLKPSKFAALVSMIPDSARESSDRLYQAMDMYLEVHARLSEAQKMSLCSALNYAKLSAEALRHLARNSKFPSRLAIKSFISKQPNAKALHNFQSFSVAARICTE